MKQLVITIFYLFVYLVAFSQQTINSSLLHDGASRDYIIYVPENYTGDRPVPLVLNFHGYTSNAQEQMNYGDFRPIADTAGFIIVHPQGSLLNGITHWNVGGWTLDSKTDDVGFTQVLLDSMAAQYNIDPKRIYSTGMSNGGYMSFLLACQLSDRIAAIASVTGSMTPQTFQTCNPQHPTPVLQIHGTRDNVVPYNGAVWTKPIQGVMEYWINFNNCKTTPEVEPYPNSDSADGSTAESMAYGNGDNKVVTEHIKISGGGHTWPGAGFRVPGTNYDFNASQEIWTFFNLYDIDGLRGTTTGFNEKESLEEVPLQVYPNPTQSKIRIESTHNENLAYRLVSCLGETLLTGVIQGNTSEIDLSLFPASLYILEVNNQAIKILKAD